MRKVKFTQDTIDEKLGGILSEFPILDNLHPFLASLLNVLYGPFFSLVLLEQPMRTAAAASAQPRGPLQAKIKG